MRRRPRAVLRASLLAGAAGVAGVLGVTGVVGVVVLDAAVRCAARGRILTVDELAARQQGPRTALVLGAQVFGDGRCSRYLRARLDLAAELYCLGLVDVLLLSGAGGAEHHDEPAAMRRHLLSVGIPDEALLLDGGGLDTYDSCLRARDALALPGVVLVSQSFHLPRAVAICRVLGLEAVAVGDESVREPEHRWRRHRRRELLANLKMLLDLASRREPVVATTR